MKPIDTITSNCIVLEQSNIDTDQIIPARFLKVTTRNGLGQHAFADWRYDKSGEQTNHLLNTPQAKTCSILLAGDNFACGSSREHAPWALLDFGIRVVISTSIADIFKNNALKNGLLPIVVSESFWKHIQQHPQNIVVDLKSCTVRLSNGLSESFSIDAFARYRLLHGMDELDFLLSKDAGITAHEAQHS